MSVCIVHRGISLFNSVLRLQRKAVERADRNVDEEKVVVYS